MTLDEFLSLKPGDLVSDVWSHPSHEPGIVLRARRTPFDTMLVWVWRPGGEHPVCPYEVPYMDAYERAWIQDDFNLIMKAP